MFIVNTSWRLGQMAHTSNPLFRYCIKKFWQMAPDSVFGKQERKINDLPYTELLN